MNNPYAIVSFQNRSADDKEQAALRFEPGDTREGRLTKPSFFEDYDRITRTREFRRLGGISQLDVLHGHRYEFQSRISHTVDVMKVGDIIARSLGLDEDSKDLINAISSGHDLGHMPFNHWGEQAAKAKLAKFGKSWNHDAAGLRVISEWAHGEGGHCGLNLTRDTIEGLAKRYWRFDPAVDEGRHNHDINELPKQILDMDSKLGLRLHLNNHIEGQIAAISDWIAFTATDIEDGLRGQRMTVDEIKKHLPMVKPIYREIFDELDPKRHVALGEPQNYVLRQKLLKHRSEESEVQKYRQFASSIRDMLIDDVVKQTKANIDREIAAGNLKNADDVRGLEHLLVSFSPQVREQLDMFQKYCDKTVFPRTLQSHGNLQEMVERTIDDIVEGTRKLPGGWNRDYKRLLAIPDETERRGALTELAVTYMTCVMDDEGVMRNIRKNHPELISSTSVATLPATARRLSPDPQGRG